MGWGNCPNYQLIRRRVVEFFVFSYLYECMSGLFNGVKISAKLSILVNAILHKRFFKIFIAMLLFQPER